jgi:hypothetical protein
MATSELFQKTYVIDPDFYGEGNIVDGVRDFFSEGAEYGSGKLVIV